MKKGKSSSSKCKQAPKTIAKPGLTRNKLILCVWWDWKNIIHNKLFCRGKAINSDLYYQQLMRLKEEIETEIKTAKIYQQKETLLSRASQDDGWLATVSDAPLPLHFIGGASVAHHYTSGHGTAVASADTSTTIFEVGRRRTPPVVLTSTTRTWLSGPEVIGEALTHAPVAGPRSTLSSAARCGSAAGAPDQEVLGVRPSASAGSMSTSVNGLELTMCSASSRGVENFFARPLSQCSGQRGFDRSH
ncbi:hypothetical protein EVAR_14029_1 [Eumeta japonica]|uniref:Mariner Mos1 transposase n=1 Tax=Eumeta variegata TaxID=151549 RepID=A0A4C1XD89_EUMVA|nr:hypothetical protein EVAR_14029_1 [Eumeta japonica]